jgi:phosphatidylglycerophosphatase A
VNPVLRVWATGFWSGFFPIAPGTMGSLLGLAVYCWVPAAWLPLGQDGHLGLAALAVLTVATATGIVASTPAEREFGKDGGPIVVDEIVGQWIAVAGLAPSLPVVIGGFLLFRLFDIFKPFPAGKSQDLKGGWGVMLDDVVAGIYAAVVLRLLLRFLPGA